MSTRFKIIFIIRTFGYMLIFTGLTGLVAFFAPLLHAEIQYRLPKPNTNQTPKTFGFQDLQQTEKMVIPVSADFGIVIEKINANAKIVGNVNPANETEYTAALKEGVAHAKGTSFPGEKGNIYLFSHSTNAPWNIIRYNAVFYLLRELEPGDEVVLFYKGRRFNYIVFDKKVVDGSDTTYLTNRYDKSVLTLQTCDPPGTLFRRLIVRARLSGS